MITVTTTDEREAAVMTKLMAGAPAGVIWAVWLGSRRVAYSYENVLVGPAEPGS